MVNGDNSQGRKEDKNFTIDFSKFYPKKTGKKSRMEFKADTMYFNIIREYQRRKDMEGSLQDALRELIKEKHVQMLLEDLFKEKPEVLEILQKCKNEFDLFDALYSKGMKLSTIDELGKIISNIQEISRFSAFKGGDRL